MPIIFVNRKRIRELEQKEKTLQAVHDLIGKSGWSSRMASDHGQFSPHGAAVTFYNFPDLVGQISGMLVEAVRLSSENEQLRRINSDMAKRSKKRDKRQKPRKKTKSLA